MNHIYFIIKGGAAEGTSCGSGKMCIQGVCTNSAIAPTGDCLFADDLMRSNVFGNFFGFSFPSPVMSCQELIDYSINSLKYPPGFLCQNSFFKTPCCNTCKSCKTFN